MPRKPIPSSLVTFIEAVIFIAAAYLGRQALDSALLQQDLPSLLIAALRILFLLALIAIAVVVDRLLFRFLRDRGWIR